MGYSGHVGLTQDLRWINIREVTVIVTRRSMRLGKNAVWEDPVSPLTGPLRFYWTVLVKPVRLGFPEISYRRESMPAGDMFRKPRRLTQNPMTQAKKVVGAGANFWYGNEQRPNLQTATQRPSTPNPIAPAAADAEANAMFSQRFPGVASSSLGASERAAGMTANNAFQSGMSNRYVGQNPMRPEFDEVAARQRAAYEMAGGPASDPTNLQGRMGGFGGGGKPWYEREAEAARQQRHADRVAAVQAANDPSRYTDRNYKGPFLTAEGAMGGRLEGLKSLPDSNPLKAGMVSAEEDSRDAAAQVYQDRLAKFKSGHGGMNARQFGIQQRQQQRMDNRFRRDVRAGMNPMSAQAMALYPDQAKRAREAYQNPMKAGTSAQTAAFQPGAPNTPENVEARNAVRGQLAEVSPTMRAFGLSGESTVSDFVPALANNTQALSDEGMRDLLSWVKTYSNNDDGSSPFKDTPQLYAPKMLDELRNLDENTDPAAIRAWYDRYRAEVRRRASEANSTLYEPVSM